MSCIYARFFFFFFSSRRRHTRFDCDWSSDVCSSDLAAFDERQAAAEGRAADARDARLHGVAEQSCTRRCKGRRAKRRTDRQHADPGPEPWPGAVRRAVRGVSWRSEEHTSELQSQSNLVCRLLLEKK